jgi:hypothetical protein
MAKSLLRLYQKYGIRTPETVAAFQEWRAAQQAQVPDPRRNASPESQSANASPNPSGRFPRVSNRTAGSTTPTPPTVRWDSGSSPRCETAPLDGVRGAASFPAYTTTSANDGPLASPSLLPSTQARVRSRAAGHPASHLGKELLDRERVVQVVEQHAQLLDLYSDAHAPLPSHDARQNGRPRSTGLSMRTTSREGRSPPPCAS